jgi:integrase
MKVRLADGSGTREYRYLWADVDRWGNERVYFKRKGKAKVRLQAKPGTAEFDDEYNAIFAGAPIVKRAPQTRAQKVTCPQSLCWLAQQYYASAPFLALDASTRKVRRAILDGICDLTIEGERVGDFPYAQMRPRDVAKLRDQKADFPEAANGRVKALRALFRWATSPEYGHAESNPAREVAYLASNNPDGFRTWSIEEIEQFERHHPIGSKPRLALDLLLLSGVRRSDVIRLGPQMERWAIERLDDGTTVRVQKLIFSEFKGRRRIEKKHELPILSRLRASIDATPSGQLNYLVTERGQPYTRAGFGNWFARQCRLAGLTGLSAHGLRKAGATIAAELGATEAQLMALYGWESTKQAGIYTKRARRQRLEAEASHLLQGQQRPSGSISGRFGRSENETLPPGQAVSSGGSFRGKKR